MFADHSSGIHTKVLNNLILVSSHHLEVLFDLQKYFEKRNNGAIFMGLIEEDEIEPNSFAVRFSENDGDMIDTRKKIRRKDNKMRREKSQEVQTAREEIDSIRKNLVNKKCHCGGTGLHRCEKCNLQKKIDGYRVSVYRSILMASENGQNAVVFELRIPDVIACLRDVLYIFVTKHYDLLLSDRKNCVSWIEHRELKEFSNGCARNVFLGTNYRYFNAKSKRAND